MMQRYRYLQCQQKKELYFDGLIEHQNQQNQDSQQLKQRTAGLLN
jgi:hypothetical protein